MTLTRVNLRSSRINIDPRFGDWISRKVTACRLTRRRSRPLTRSSPKSMLPPGPGLGTSTFAVSSSVSSGTAIAGGVVKSRTRISMTWSLPEIVNLAGRSVTTFLSECSVGQDADTSSSAVRGVTAYLGRLELDGEPERAGTRVGDEAERADVRVTVSESSVQTNAMPERGKIQPSRSTRIVPSGSVVGVRSIRVGRTEGTRSRTLRLAIPQSP